jgi:lipopolysaccharide/colanic/teichoic acid biosynthesis glycosyltransferase
MEVGAEARLRSNPRLHGRFVRNGYKLPPGEDPRVTWIGKWLRRTYVDEIPQLFNVIAGCMSLVGPRPIIADELEHYGDDAADLLRSKPGIIGAWTVRGRERPDYPARALIELEYLRTRTARRDLAILLRSIPVVLRGQDDG